MLQLQQLDVLQDEQLEHEHDDELAAMSMDGSASSSISNVTASRSRNSMPSVLADMFPPFVSCDGVLCGAGDQPPPQPVLVLVEQQLDVLHDEQLEQEQLELHQPAASWPTSVMSSTSNVAVSRSSSSS
ncbi:hypothetical protein [Phytoactinopolyspora mesophila]|uniref:Uncharacterized protein n=1 Tax=Phytoactinopolyspora mesophila TaxID=2650750 RepID=A0A7K3MA48_9ACTN|nr:hypothetical protein [Phytoactinopolyspora mesophila]NDL60164.1 hypothetical protein [Phytoactinopolyspora mesophila]